MMEKEATGANILDTFEKTPRPQSVRAIFLHWPGGCKKTPQIAQ
jgi:hypothetical protein